jgi:hypothetical protein
MKLMKFDQIFEAGTQSITDPNRNIPTGGYKNKEEVFGKEQPKDVDKTARIKISNELEKVLKNLEDNDSYLAFEMLWLGESGSKYVNGLGITDVTISTKSYCFEVSIAGKK